MKQGIVFFVLAILSLFFQSCDTTNPPDDDNGSGLDTTSHLIKWFIEDLGEYGSILRDVAIINDTLAYAVGEIYLNDSLGQQDPQAYGIAIWNGQTWEARKLFYNTNIVITPRGIFVISQNEIYLAAGSIFRWDGTSSMAQLVYSRLNLPNPNGTIEKIWGSSGSSIYGVGNAGSIVFFSGSSWQSSESSTEVNLTDVWGSPDGSIIWAAGFEDSYGTVFLRNTGSGFEKVLEITDPNMPHPPDQITHVFKSLWTDKADTVYLGAIGRVYAAPKNTSGYAKENIWWDYANEPGYPPETNIIRGAAGNDIFVGGYLQFVRHWNGASWKGYDELEGDGTWRGMAIKNDLIIIVGENFNNGNARIARGYRIQ